MRTRVATVVCGMAMALTGGLGSPASAAPFYVAQTGYQERQTSRSLCGSKGGWFLEVYRIMVTPANGDIYARLVKANGTLGPLAGIELTGTHSGNPCAAYGPDTNLFGVVWEQGPAVRFRLVQPPTAAMSADFIVAAPLAVGEVCRSPAIAYLGNGCFLVVWVLELDGDRVAHARVVKADCTMTSPRPLHSSGLADHPAVASAGWGGGVAVWEHEHMAAGAQTDIVARSVSASGAVLGANPTALTKTAAEERRPQIAASPAVGTCLAVWESLAWPQPLTARYLDAWPDGTIHPGSTHTVASWATVAGWSPRSRPREASVAWDPMSQGFVVAWCQYFWDVTFAIPAIRAALLSPRPGLPHTVWFDGGVSGPSVDCPVDIPQSYRGYLMYTWNDSATGSGDIVGGGETTRASVHLNDFLADSRSDLAVYEPVPGRWRMRTLGGTVTANVLWGNADMTPVMGDYNNDRVCDLACYHRPTGNWYIRRVGAGAPICFGVNWGGPDCDPVPGDYNGGGSYDLAVYQRATGNWYIRTVGAGAPICVGLSWGGSDCDPVPGDYDGDGRFDLAVYRRATGHWYIRRVGAGAPICVGLGWGGAGMVPVPGDYDGDGMWDLAVYERATGKWYIRSVNPTAALAICLGLTWGDASTRPVPGDYNGDGIYDLAVYQRSTGAWFIRSLRHSVPISPGIVFGGPGAEPVGVCR